ncbi:hypothetical protein [Vibrio diabolicus]|uniref:hypothetical protein n=1 Tax=Vibrio diabolicus TaxID=50719 RepID=UPI001EEDE6BD|nr:hypothetical protein [Vibrio diabolicus]
MTQHKIIGIDLAKNIFFLVEINHKGKNLNRKKLQRSKLLNYVAMQSPCIIAMEACSGTHYWARKFEKLGHEVLLYPPQHVKISAVNKRMTTTMLKRLLNSHSINGPTLSNTSPSNSKIFNH